MNLLHAIILGITQGLTEFLPISSSAHLVLVPDLLQIPYPSLTFDVYLHVGTLAAVLFYYRADLASIIRGFFQGDKDARQLVGWILLSTIPAAIAGVIFHDLLEEMFSSPVFPAIFLLVTGALLWWADQTGGEKDYKALGVWGALFVGCFQALALLPGVSRSGTTIAAARQWGLSREEAARFSFLLSIPIISGVGLIEALPLISGQTEATMTLPYLGGIIAAAVSGFLVIRFFLRYLKQGKLRPFSIYCWLVGLFFLAKVLF